MATPPARPPTEPLVRAEGLELHFPLREGWLFQRTVGRLRAVDGIDLTISEGETLGLVGESGCGKSTTGRALLQLLRPTAGEVYFRGEALTRLRGEALRRRRRDMQMIFQDPYASLNPRMTVGQMLAEPLRVHDIARGAEAAERVEGLLAEVGLNPAYRDRYPHEFSGGQRQRIGIARALAVNPDFVVCDEPISALDVSIQAQIINLLERLQARWRLTYLFIAHDLAVVRHIADRVAVMYLGRIVELAPRDELYEHPQHPYTRALLSAVPLPDPVAEATRERILLTGEIPSAADPPPGCRFHTRCPIAIPLCHELDPPLREIAPHHHVACHLVD